MSENDGMRGIALVALLVVGASGQPVGSELHADSAVSIALPGGTEHSWTISLPEGQVANLKVTEKSGLAGVLEVVGDGESELVEADLSQRAPAAKNVLIPSGAREIRIHPADHGTTERLFDFRIAPSRARGAQDDARIQAERLLGEGERLSRTRLRADLEKAIGLFEKTLPLRDQKTDAARQADTLLHLGAVRSVLGQTKEALSAYQRALDLWTAQSDHAGMASAYCEIAVISLDTGKQKLAEEDAGKCLDIEHELNDPRGMATALEMAARLHHARGENDQARADFERALDAARQGGDRLMQGQLLTDIGDFEGSLASWQEAEAAFEKALAIARSEGDKLLLARSLGNLASNYIDLGELRKAVGYLEEALSLKRNLSEPNSYATSLYNLANSYSKLDEYEQARVRFNEALAIFQKTSFARGQGYVLTAQGRLALNIGDETKAESLFRQAQTQWRLASDRQGEVFALNGLGEVATRRGQHERAVAFHRQALDISRADGLPREEERTLGYLADAYYEMRDARSSLEQSSSELAIIGKIGDPDGRARALYQQGRAFRSLGDFEQAQTALDQALQMNESFGSPTHTADTLYELAALDRDRGLLAEANSKIGKAVDLLEAAGADAGSAETRMLFAASHRRNYDLAIELAMRSGAHAKAFELSERARARTFVDLVRGARLDIRQGVDPALLKQEVSIRETLNQKQDRFSRLAASSRNTAAEAQAKKEIDALVEEYENVEAQIRRTSPRYAALVEPHTLSLTDVQTKLLDAQTALIEFWLGEEHSYGWLVTKTDCKAFELPARREVEDRVRRAYEALTARNVARQETPEQRQARIAAADREFAAVSAELSRMLLGPIAGFGGARRIWVVSDGALEYLPFAALSSPGSTVPLVSSFEITRLPSASVLAEVRQQIARRQPAPRFAAVFADPVFQSDDERIVKNREAGVKDNPADLPRAFEDVDLASLPRLWFSRREAEAVAALAPRGSVRVALDFEASRAEAQKPSLADYRVLHFATHAFLDSLHPELSGLVLSMVDRDGHPQDGFLRLNEIYNMKLNADLAVLSGCRTALGREVRGEGLVGLTRGFMYAGAPQVVASLWDVRDRATADFMKGFYEALLRRHLSPEAALRSAQLAMMKNPGWSQPYYWAAFTMQGAR